MSRPMASSSAGLSSAAPGGTHWVTAPAPGVVQIQPWSDRGPQEQPPHRAQLVRAAGRVVEHPRPGGVGREGECQRVGHQVQVVGSGPAGVHALHHAPAGAAAAVPSRRPPPTERPVVRYRRATCPGRSGAGSAVVAHQVAVDGGGGRPALGDGPHDQALAPGHVAAHEHVVDVGRPLLVGGHAAPGVELEAEVGDDPVRLGPEEPHGQQDQLAGQLELAAGHGVERRPPVGPGGQLDLVAPQAGHRARLRRRRTRRW